MFDIREILYNLRIPVLKHERRCSRMDSLVNFQSNESLTIFDYRPIRSGLSSKEITSY